jgi:hypothetical protein
MKESVKSETIKVKPIAMKIILTKFLVENPTKPYTPSQVFGVIKYCIPKATSFCWG